MKPSMLGLLIAAGAFGASTIYLAVQLHEERAQADGFIAQTRVLNARIAELEKARLDIETDRFGLDGPEITGPPTSRGGNADAGHEPPKLAAKTTEAEIDVPRERFGGPPVRTEAMQKMMRSQMRVGFKRMYADVGDKLGLSKDEANKLVDLLIDQQNGIMDRGRQDRAANLTPEQRSAAWASQNEKNLAEVAALIGTDKVEAYKAYQETMPARQEVERLSQQLEANDVSLSKNQRELMITALAEERNRVPQPKMSESVSREEYAHAMTAWQDDYNQRTATRAGSILSSEQQTTYGEYQQWTKEMRQQFENRRSAREGGGPPPR